MFPLLAILLAAQAAPAPGACTFDRAAMLALGEDAFDQDMTGGWRKLDNAGCHREAADLIRDWREAHPDAARQNVSFWHEGQLRAIAGQTERAAALFDRSRKLPADDAMGWNHYVDGSIAFLRGDRRSFDAARARLAALPRPADFDPRGPDGKSLVIAWPMNLNVLDGLRRCWGKSYDEAYGPGCAAPMRRVRVSPR